MKEIWGFSAQDRNLNKFPTKTVEILSEFLIQFIHLLVEFCMVANVKNSKTFKCENVDAMMLFKVCLDL